MQATHMTYKEETLRLRRECSGLRKSDAIYRNANKKLKERISKQEKEIKGFRQENREFKKENKQLKNKQKEQAKELEKLKLIVEELRQMIFGKGKKDDNNDRGDNDKGDSDQEDILDPRGEKKQREKANRSKSSYRRPTPKEEEVTDTYNHPLDFCLNCGSMLVQVKQIIRYVEDIIELSQMMNKVKKVEKHIITSGYCPNCKKRYTGKEISPQVCCLGSNVRQFIVHQNIVMGLSFEQIRNQTNNLFNINISDGDITNTLDQEARKLIPEKDKLLNQIRGEPGVHYDETSWKIQKGGQGNYAWVATGTQGQAAVFLLGRSRGKANAEELHGGVDIHVGITDDYPAYKNLFKEHQLCWAHPNRKLRDLKDSGILDHKKHNQCQKIYTNFNQLYKELQTTLSNQYDKTTWTKQKKEYEKRLLQLAIVNKEDPEKLENIKTSLKKNKDKYFTCLTKPGIPADNNKAERSLRHLVLKRKKSFGSKTQKGAETMAILYSTVLSKWWSKPKNFWKAYNKMIFS